MINGSPHPHGCTYTALHEMEQVLQAAGVETQILTVGAEQAGGCTACGGCNATGHCVRGGLVNDAIDAMETADALVLASPVHYAGISGAMSAFCDRLFYASDGWANKPCACVVSARRAGTTAALDQLVKYPMISNMPVVSSQYWNSVHGNTPEEVRQDKEGLQIMRTLGDNMAWLLKNARYVSMPGIAYWETVDLGGDGAYLMAEIRFAGQEDIIYAGASFGTAENSDGVYPLIGFYLSVGPYSVP